MKRALSPSLNPTGLGASAAAIYAAVIMIWHWTHHHGVIDPQVLVAAAGAAAFLYARFKVTPVADPHDGNGKPLLRLDSTLADVERAKGGTLPPGLTTAENRTSIPERVVPPTGTVKVVPPEAKP